jgi:hypothetical protein
MRYRAYAIFNEPAENNWKSSEMASLRRRLRPASSAFGRAAITLRHAQGGGSAEPPHFKSVRIFAYKLHQSARAAALQIGYNFVQ